MEKHEKYREIAPYIKDANRTDLSPEQYDLAGTRATAVIRLDHAFTGIQTEVGELVDIIKRYKFYGKEIDVNNLKEEVGDLMWYTAILMDEVAKNYDIKPEEILLANIEKLKARYPEKFNEENALNRDLNAESKALNQEKDGSH